MYIITTHIFIHTFQFILVFGFLSSKRSSNIVSVGEAPGMGGVGRVVTMSPISTKLTLKNGGRPERSSYLPYEIIIYLFVHVMLYFFNVCLCMFIYICHIHV